MVVTRDTQNYITIEANKQTDAIFLINSLSLGINSIPLNSDDKRRMINFIKELQFRLGINN